MDNINISGVDFSSSLPKWATDEVLKKIHKHSQLDTRRETKEHKEVLAALSNIYKDGLKRSTDDKKQNDEIIKQLKTLVSLTKASNSTSGGSTKPSSSSSNNQTSSSIVTQTKEISNKLSATNKLLNMINTTLLKGVNASSGSRNKNTTIQQTSTKSNTSPRGSSSDITANASNSVEERLAKALSRRGIGGNVTGNTLTGSANNRIQQAIANQSAQSMGVLSKVIARLGFFGKVLLKFGRLIPGIGTIITAITSLAAIIGTAIDTIKRYAWDSHIELKAMMKSGFSFTKDITERGRIDGIKLDKMLLSSGLTVERAMAIVEKNAATVNQLGLGAFASHIKSITEDFFSSGQSFESEIGLHRNEIAEFATQYTNIQMNLINGELKRSDLSARATQQFIADTRMFGQVSGQGMQVIIDKMNELSKRADYRLAMQSRSDAGKRATEEAALWASTMGGVFGDVMFEALADTRGLSIYGTTKGSEMMVALRAAGVDPSMINRMDSLAKAIQTDSGIDKEATRREFEAITAHLKGFEIGQIQAKTVLNMKGEYANMAMDVIGTARTLNIDAMRQGPSGTDMRHTTELAQSQHRAEIAMAQLENAKQMALAQASDTAASRYLLTGSLDALTFLNDTGTSILSSLINLNDILGNVLDSVRGIFDKLNPFGGETPEEKRNRENIEKIVENAKSKEGLTKEGTDVLLKGLGLDSVLGSRNARVAKGHAEEILKTYKATGDSADLGQLSYIIGNEHIPQRIKNAYLEAIDNYAKENTDSSRSMMAALGVDVGYKDKLERENRQRKEEYERYMEAQKSASEELEKSPVAEQVAYTNKEVEEKQAREQEERERVKAQREQEEKTRIEKEKLEENKQKTTESLPIPAAPQMIVNEVGSEMIGLLKTLNSKIDDMIRLQKEFNSTMTIQIIKA